MMKSPTSLISIRNAVGVMLALSAVFAVVLSTVSMPGDRAFGQMTTMNNSQKVMAARDALEDALVDPHLDAGNPATAAADTDGKITLLQRAVAAINDGGTGAANIFPLDDGDPSTTEDGSYVIKIQVDDMTDPTADPLPKVETTVSEALTNADLGIDGSTSITATGLDEYLVALLAARGPAAGTEPTAATAADTAATAGNNEAGALLLASNTFDSLKGMFWNHDVATDTDGSATPSLALTDATKATLDGLNNSLLTTTPADLAAFKTSVENAIKSDGNWYPEDPPTLLPIANVTDAAVVAGANEVVIATQLNALFNPNTADDGTDDSGALVVLKSARTAESEALAGAKAILEAVQKAVDAAELPAVDKAIYATTAGDPELDTEAEVRAVAAKNLATAEMLLKELVDRLNASSNREEFTARDELAVLYSELRRVMGELSPRGNVVRERFLSIGQALLKNNNDNLGVTADTADPDDRPDLAADSEIHSLRNDALDHIISALEQLSDLDGTSAQMAAIVALDDVLTKVDAAVTATGKADDGTTATTNSSSLTQSDVDRLKAALDAFDALKMALEDKHIDTDPSVDANSVADHRMALNMLADADVSGRLDVAVATAATALTTALQEDGDETTGTVHEPSDTFKAFDASGLLATALAENPGLTDTAGDGINQGVSVTTAELGAALGLTRTQTAGADTPNDAADDTYEMSTDDYHATLVAMVALLGVDTVPDVAGTEATIGTQSQAALVTLGNLLGALLDADSADDATAGKLDVANAAAEAYRSTTLAYNAFTAMAALQSALNGLDSATASDIDEKVRVAREALIAARDNKDGLTSEIQTELDTAYAALISQGSTQHAYAQRAALIVVRDALADGKATEGLAASIQSRLTTQSPEQQQAQAMISRIEPSIRGITVSGGEKVRLTVEIYGLQDKQDQDLGDSVTFAWSVDPAGGTLPDEEAGNSTITYTSPTSPGTYTVTAALDSNECYHEEADVQAEKCSAEFELRVRRAAPPQAEDPAPVNPPGEIPSILSDGDGNNYEVFTPVEGGTFDSGEGYSITAEPGAVPNGEFIGVRMSDDGPASNVGMTHQRYTLGGNMYGVHAVDSSEASVSDYPLDDPATVCVPLPDVLRGNISDLALVTLNSDGSLTILAANVRIGAAGTSVCGNLSNLPASVAVGSQGAPDAIPTATPEPEPVLPDTGATAPSSNSALWALFLGIAIVSLGTLTALSRRRNRSVSR